MRINVLIIPDKFKGTLNAHDVARAIGSGWRSARPKDKLTLLPMSDGGDGFGHVIGSLLSAQSRRINTIDAAHRPIKAQWWWARNDNTAIIESAAVIGLAKLPPGKYHPFQLDTTGLGKVLEQAATTGASKCIIGIGGSATNDGGFGIARAVGWKFLDRNGVPIDDWRGLDQLAAIVPPASQKLFREISVAVDVTNPLLGPRGATRVYGPQKGMLPADFAAAERALTKLARCVEKFHGQKIDQHPGAGAAGGLGFGLAAFLNAELISGFDLFTKLSHLNKHLANADLVITGEGQLDSSTLMGKGVGQIAACCKKAGIPCIGLAGSVSIDASNSTLFSTTRSLLELANLPSAMAKPRHWLRRLGREIAREWNPRA